MDKKWLKDIIDYLLYRKFPNLFKAKELTTENKDEIEKYKITLEYMSKEELWALYSEESTKSKKEKEEQTELSRFYNSPKAKADLAHYSKLSFWMVEEAASLCYNKDPEIVNSSSIKLYSESPFVKGYYKTLKIIELAIDNDEIATTYKPRGIGYTKLFTPLNFINWAKKKYIEVPEELESLVKKYNFAINETDWETKCKKLEILCNELQATIDKQEEKLRVPDPRRLSSWKKGFIGILALKYGPERIIDSFGTHLTITTKNLQSKKNPVTKAQITNDLAKSGIELDDQTLTNLIKESIDELEKAFKNLE